MFETIENLMAFPAGRGNGTEKDDIYSIGATCISLLQGKNPLKDMSVPEIIRMKMKKGSYSALTFDDKIPSIFTTILKGLTTDEPVNRWNFIQTYNFIEGKGTNFSAQTSTEKPKRSLTINGEKCYTAQEVAYYLYLNSDESWDLIKSKSVQYQCKLLRDLE
jgi:hypothetical protein